MDETKKILVQASGLPLSVIIIGVGNEQFAMMRELDSDGQILRSSDGKAAMRDIVQFVRFQDFLNAGSSSLASEVLKEIPDQLVQ
jgi:hypothetical protein